MRSHYDFSKDHAMGLYKELRAILDEQDISFRDFAAILWAEKVSTNSTTLSRILNAENKPSAWLIQGIARNQIIRENLVIPDSYCGGSITDYLLDRMSGNDSYLGNKKLVVGADDVDAKEYDSKKNLKTQGGVTVVAHKNRKAARILSKALGDRSIGQASKITGIPEDRMQDLIEGSEPSIQEYARLSRLFSGDGAADYLEAFGSNLS